jgi:hypothetical protein
MEETAQPKRSVRKRADAVKQFRCKNLIAVLENPTDVKNIGTVIRNVNALASRRSTSSILAGTCRTIGRTCASGERYRKSPSLP